MDIDPMNENAEFREGGQACIARTSREDCPYLVWMRGAVRRDPDEAKAIDWLRGWDFAWRLERAAFRERLAKTPNFPVFGA